MQNIRSTFSLCGTNNNDGDFFPHRYMLFIKMAMKNKNLNIKYLYKRKLVGGFLMGYIIHILFIYANTVRYVCFYALIFFSMYVSFALTDEAYVRQGFNYTI